MKIIKAGEENTEATLEKAFAFAAKADNATVVVASTWGTVGTRAASLGALKGVPVVVVTHNVGFKAPGAVELDAAHRESIEAAGARVLTGTMVLRGIGSAFKKKFGTSDEDITAAVLRMFGQGMKVCAEMAAMVSDAGLVPPNEDIVCVAGTGRGADTAVWIRPASSNNFFDIKIKEVICKPNEF